MKNLRRIKYFAAMSLDAFIAGPDGEVDWLFMDQDYGLNDFFAGIDTVLIGRKTYEFMLSQGLRAYKGVKNFVFSGSLNPEDFPEVSMIGDGAAEFVEGLLHKPGKDLWLIGGGELFRLLLSHDLVDEIILAVHPVLLGRGIPMLAEMPRSVNLKLTDVRTFDTGLVLLSHTVTGKARE